MTSLLSESLSLDWVIIIRLGKTSIILNPRYNRVSVHMLPHSPPPKLSQGWNHAIHAEHVNHASQQLCHGQNKEQTFALNTPNTMGTQF